MATGKKESTVEPKIMDIVKDLFKNKLTEKEAAHKVAAFLKH